MVRRDDLHTSEVLSKIKVTFPRAVNMFHLYLNAYKFFVLSAPYNLAQPIHTGSIHTHNTRNAHKFQIDLCF